MILTSITGWGLEFSIAGAFLDSLSRERDSDTVAYCVSMRFPAHYHDLQ